MSQTLTDWEGAVRRDVEMVPGCADCLFYGNACATHVGLCPGCGGSNTRMHNGEAWCWGCDPDEHDLDAAQQAAPTQ